MLHHQEADCRGVHWITGVTILSTLDILFCLVQLTAVFPNASCISSSSATTYRDLLLAHLCLYPAILVAGFFSVWCRVREKLIFFGAVLLWLAWLILFVLMVHYWEQDIGKVCPQDSSIVLVGVFIVLWQASIMCMGPLYIANQYYVASYLSTI